MNASFRTVAIFVASAYILFAFFVNCFTGGSGGSGSGGGSGIGGSTLFSGIYRGGGGGYDNLQELKLTLPKSAAAEKLMNRNTTLYYGKNVLLNYWLTRENEPRYRAFVVRVDDDNVAYSSCRVVVNENDYECIFAATRSTIHPRIYFDYKHEGEFDDFYLDNMKPLGIPIGPRQTVQPLEPDVAIDGGYDVLKQSQQNVAANTLTCFYGTLRSTVRKESSNYDVIKRALFV